MSALTTALFVGLGLLNTVSLTAEEPIPEYWLKLMRTKMSSSRIDFEKKEFLELVDLRNAKPEDFGTSLGELAEMEKQGFASESCRIWNEIDSITRVNHKWLLNFITPAGGSSISEFHQSRKAFYAAYIRAGDRAVCSRSENEWIDLHRKLSQLVLLNKACDELSIAQDTTSEEVARLQFENYTHTIDTIEKQDLTELVPENCTLTDIVTLQVMRAPVHNILIQRLQELSKATENMKRAELTFSEAVKNYQANEKRPETIRLRKRVEKQTFNTEGK